jgi:hypothetical protein
MANAMKGRIPSTACRMLACLLLAGCAGAHDIPNDVAIQAFLKPEGNLLRMIVRVPMRAMRDVEFPQKGPQGYLDLELVQPRLMHAAQVWIADSIVIEENDTRLPAPRIVSTRVSLESDKSFLEYGQALAHVTGPKLPPETNVVWNQTNLDVLLEYPIQSDRSLFSILPGFGRLGVRVVTALRFLPPGGAVRAFEFQSDPGLVRLDPRWYQAAARFVREGFFHILDGSDHLLFLACLVIPFRKFRSLVPIVTAFTAAHSVTLIASAYDLAPDALWFPPLVETLIAASIVYMALENIAGAGAIQRRWIIAFGFGLVHGFGFSFALRETLQFAGTHLLTSLLSFNLGIEAGQLLVLAALVPLLELLFRYTAAERMGVVILSAIVAHTGWHWMTERGERLMQFRFEWPAFDALLLASLLRGLMLFVALAALLWLASLVARRWQDREKSAVRAEASDS